MNSAVTSTQIVNVRNVSKSFSGPAGPTKVLDDISFSVEEGEFVALCGKSGVGKSTILRIIAGLEIADAGDVTVLGNVVKSPVSSVGYVIQDYSRSLLPWFTVIQNVALPLRAQRWTRREARVNALRILDRVGLAQSAEMYPWQLSGGMQQRVAIARALVTSPQLLLLDEPFASVDAQTRLELEDLVLDCVAEDSMSVILVTHDLEEALYMSDKTLVVGGSPARELARFSVSIPRPRSQVTTRALPEFLELRSELHHVIARGSVN